MFTIALPVGAVDAPAPTTAHRRSKTNPGQRTILVVDDEAEIRETLAEILTGAQHRVVTVASGREALERMAAEHYDVILTDIRMPDLDGRALYQEIERRWPGRAARVVFVTGDTLAVGAARVRRRERPPGDREAVPAERGAPRRRRIGHGRRTSARPDPGLCPCAHLHGRRHASQAPRYDGVGDARNNRNKTAGL